MQFADRVKDYSETNGTGSIALNGATITGFRPFNPAVPVGVVIPYAIVAQAGGQWEVGEGKLTSSLVLERTRVTASSSSGAKINFSAGTKEVFCSLPASVIAAGLLAPDDVGFDIIMCVGQSNMGGSTATTYDPLIDVGDPGQVYQWANLSSDSASYRKIITGVDPMYMPDGLRTGRVSPATWAAKAYLGTVPRNRRVLLVPSAVGSTGLVGAEWQPGNPGGQYYERAITEGNLALAAALMWYPTSRIVGAIWIQGENDGLNGTTQAQYAAALKALIAGFRTRLTGASNLWFVIGGMTPEGITAQPGEVPIDLAHTQVAAETDKCVKVPGFSGYASGVHYTTIGVRMMGSKMGLASVPARVSVGADVTAPTVVSAAVSNALPTKVVLTMTEPLDEAYTPANSAFTVGGHTVSGVLVSGASITLTVDAFVNGEAARTLTYTQPGANNVRDLVGNLLASFSGTAIVNNVLPVDVTPPVFSSAQVANATPTVVQITMNETLAAVVPATSCFAASGGKSVTGVSIAGAVVSITVNSAYVFGDTITIQYTNPGSGNRLQDAAANMVASFGPSAVTNNVGAAATVPDAPTIGTATGGDASASVAFTAPTSNGGSAITGYTATSTPGGLTGTGVSSPINVSGLVNGTAYTFKVKATNAIGTGAESAASNSVTPAVVTATYTTLNPSDKDAGITLSNGNLTAAATSGYKSARAISGKSTGKWYFEAKLTNGGSAVIGFGQTTESVASFPGTTVKGWGYTNSGPRYWAGVISETLAAFVLNDVIGVAVDMDAKTAQMYKNGVAQGSSFGLYQATGGTVPLAAGVAVYPMLAPNSSTLVANFGTTAFAYTPPAGYTGWTV